MEKKRKVSGPYPRILSLEQDRATLDLYCRELSQEFDVNACTTRDDALQFINGDDLDAVILEPDALNGQGWDLLNILTQSSRHESVPVILCSVLDERKRGMALGARVFLVKPILPTQLSETLHRVLEKKEIK